MALNVDFFKKYAALIGTDILQRQARAKHHHFELPDKYRKNFIHPEDSFVKLFCEEYD